MPKRGEVRLRIKAASLNYRDWLTVVGHYNPRQRIPFIPGSDGAGVIDAIGEDVTRFKVSDRAIGCFAPYFEGGQPTKERIARTLGGPIDGTFAEAIVLPEAGVVPTPEALSDREAATLPCAAVTAWNAVVAQGETKPGDTVLVQGTGGVSLFALQFARMAGANVIVTSSSDEKLEKARALGASHTINYKATPDWEKGIRATCDLVVEVGGANTLEQSIKATKPGGRVMVIGVLSGGKTQLTLASVLMQNIRLQGVLVGSRDMFEAMLRVPLAPVLDRTFPLSEAAEALAYLHSGAHFGKVTLDI